VSGVANDCKQHPGIGQTFSIVSGSLVAVGPSSADDLGPTPNRTSLRDVARLAGVSTSTASRVLSGSSHPVGEGTRRRVLAAAEQLNFAPNRLARALVTARSLTIAALVHDIADPYFAEILGGLEDVIGRSGYSLLVASSLRDPAKELAYVEAFQAYQVDAIVFAASGLTDPDYVAKLSALLDPYRRRGGVVVALSEHRYPSPSVRVANYEAAEMAVAHLAGLGHRRIGFIGGPAELAVSERRLAGYRNGLDRAGLASQSRLVVEGDFSLEGGRAAVGRLVDQGITAVIGANDMLAIGAMRELVELGVLVPGEVSVVGINNVVMAEYGPVPLTTIQVPTTVLGRRGGQLVLAMLERQDRQMAETDIVLSPELIIRKSSGPPPTPDPPGVG
jgi:LacI family transcriptional regulator